MKLPFGNGQPDELYERFRLAGEDWARANADAERYEEQRKSIYGALYLHSEGKTVAERECAAYASEVYKTHVEKMVTARELANLAKAKLDAAKVWFEASRSLESTRRAEMGMR
jgi:hypothetical protein